MALDGAFEDALQIELSLACGDVMRVQHVAIHEAISSLFSVNVVALSPDPCVDFGAIVGQAAALRISPEGTCLLACMKPRKI